MSSLEALVTVPLAVLALAPLGAGVGFRVTIEARGVTVTKHWLGVPYRARTVPLEGACADVYWVFESPEPDGAIIRQRLEPPGFESELWILGTSKNADRLAAALGEELAFVRAAIAPTPTYRA